MHEVGTQHWFNPSPQEYPAGTGRIVFDRPHRQQAFDHHAFTCQKVHRSNEPSNEPQSFHLQQTRITHVSPPYTTAFPLAAWPHRNIRRS